MNTNTITREFFDSYAAALLDRDAARIAHLYAVPSLILFPDQSIPVSDAAQTEQFFEASFGQYEGTTDASFDIDVVAEAEHSIWADVTWTYGGSPAERFVYQLVQADDTWKIAVLTPLRI